MLPLHVFPFGFNVRFSFWYIVRLFRCFFFILCIMSFQSHVRNCRIQEYVQYFDVVLVVIPLLTLWEMEMYCTSTHKLDNFFMWIFYLVSFFLRFFSLTFFRYLSLHSSLSLHFAHSKLNCFRFFLSPWCFRCSMKSCKLETKTRKASSCNWRQEQIVYKPFEGSILNLFIFPWCFHNVTTDESQWM